MKVCGSASQILITSVMSLTIWRGLLSGFAEDLFIAYVCAKQSVTIKRLLRTAVDTIVHFFDGTKFDVIVWTSHEGNKHVGGSVYVPLENLVRFTEPKIGRA